MPTPPSPARSGVSHAPAQAQLGARVPTQLAESSVVVAHPDDEVLWFSSLLQDIGQVVVCFEECDDLPELGPGRRAVRAEYPLPKVHWLREAEPCSVQLVDWNNPRFGEHGLELNAASTTSERRQRYANSYTSLQDKLARVLQGKRCVFTHNPWGEYGHADHVQVARVLESLRAPLGFELFFSGYVASRSMPLCALELPRLQQAFSLPTNPALAEPLVELYAKHGCWTWPLDYQRFDTESFLQAGAVARPGSGFTLNCVSA